MSHRFPGNVRRSQVFEGLFDLYMKYENEESFELVLPSASLHHMGVWKVAYERYGLSVEVTWIIQAFVRPQRVEKLAFHLLMLLETGWLEEVYWLQRQKQVLLYLQHEQ